MSRQQSTRQRFTTLLQVIRSAPGISRSGICDQVHKSASTISNDLHAMVKDGLLDKEVILGKAKYTVAEQAKEPEPFVWLPTDSGLLCYCNGYGEEQFS